MSSAGCSPSTSSSLQDDSAVNSRKRKPLRIRFVMKRPRVEPNTEELVHTGIRDSTSEHSGSNARDGDFGTILNDEWSSWFTGRRGRKRKTYTTPDSIETPDITQVEAPTSKGNVETSTSTTTTKDKSIGTPISEGQTSSTMFAASAYNAAEHEAMMGHMTCNNKNGKSVAANEELKTHKCKSCPAAFATGQQLGGHMRAHFKGTLTISASSKRAKGKGVAEAGASSGTGRDSKASSITDDDRTKYTAAASFSTSVTRDFLIAFDLNEPPSPEEEEQLNIHEGEQMLELTL